MGVRGNVFNALKWSYKVLRSVVFSAIIVVVVLFTLLYVTVSVPYVQDRLRDLISVELETLLDTDVEIGSLDFRPLNEVIVEGVRVSDRDGKECVVVGRLGAGINLWKFLSSGKIEITYVELLDFNVDIYQKTEDAPLNIAFIIEALSSKDENKPKTRFDLMIHNIVLRGGTARFDRLWKPERVDGAFNTDHISLTGISGDITIPRLSNDFTEIDLRRLAFNEKAGLQVKEIGGLFRILPGNVEARDFILRLPETAIRIPDLAIPLDFMKTGETVRVEITGSKVTPSNLSAFFPPLASLDITLPLEGNFSVSKNSIDIKDFKLGNPSILILELTGKVENISDKDNLNAALTSLSLHAPSESILPFLSLSGTGSDDNLASRIISALGYVDLELSGNYTSSDGKAGFTLEIDTSRGKAEAAGEVALNPNSITGNTHLFIPAFNLEGIGADIHLTEVSEVDLKFDGHVNLLNPVASTGNASFSIGGLGLGNRHVENIDGSVWKETASSCTAKVYVNDSNLEGSAEASVILDGENSEWNLMAMINDFDTYSSFIAENTDSGYELQGGIEAHAKGNTIDNMTGNLSLSGFRISKWNGKSMELENLLLSVTEDALGKKTINLETGIVDANVNGEFTLSLIPGMISSTLHEVCPALFPAKEKRGECGYGFFTVSVRDARSLIEFFDLPVFPLTALEIEGNFNSETDHIEIATDIPYIQQGKNNLITDTYLNLEVTGEESALKFLAGTVYPTKKGLLKLDVDVGGAYGDYGIRVDFNRGRNVSFHGEVELALRLAKDAVTDKLLLKAGFYPSALYLNEAEWKMERSEILYTDGYLRVSDFCLRHDNQFVTISGSDSKDEGGLIKVELADMNLDYIFDTLNIPHVTFGGTATGLVTAREIFTKAPDISTNGLSIDSFSYNGALLGHGDVHARLDLPAKKVAIGALIDEDGRRVAEVDGGVWFGRDSLAFDFKADRVNVGFMQPFMSAFSSDIKGRASGEALLYGTFSDIDMTGKLVAEDVDIMIDYINARYQGSDTVYLYPSRIEIPGLTVRDKYGHTATVSGELTHRYFHEPSFRFLVTEMNRLLVYDTNARINPLWYGQIFATGSGEIYGRPGMVRIAADVTTAGGSDFTFVLSDKQEAVKSHFLTFSDRRKEAEEALAPKDTLPDFLQRFHRQKQEETESSDVYVMDFRVSVTDGVRLNLIMDPVAGDKIVAYGSGAMNLTYSSLTDDLRIYGKYVLDKGTYNFSLQDIILKEFIIKPGSSIAFTGNPYAGILDITAAYRVNTSLTELDKSFASDRELNRTSVPVEALLKVTGVLTSPNIDFDIELPTVTEETARKVRSIISTDDMMSRQVLYLVALNKFYPPEYMSTANTGGEWASIASSTLSSQIQNMIGKITDKFTVAPSIRSDKGDFSDIEVDLALSSQLFHNRLLINGNIGYRDPSNSSTTFVGDFDLEYLLNKKGNWRLKAYNHFNDQNYYLKSALTTQGIGIVWRKDFGLPRKSEEEKEQPADETTEPAEP